MSEDFELPLSANSPSTPRPFGRYRLLQRIGAGGMAEIFRAIAVGEQGFERTVAIKRIREEVVELADIGKLFADEARVSALLDHPNIVQVYDFGAVDGAYYIAMEYLKGRNLEQVLTALRMRSERLAPSLAVLIARDVARGLAYAHTRTDEQGRPLNIVHRDVSPANIMLTQMGSVKLLDFGIARITSELRLAITRGHALRGKCPYLAPEQITNEGEPDGRADLFALGAVLWEMLTNRRLFVGSSDFEILASVLNREIPAPSSLVPGLPPQLDEVVCKVLARDPQQRYQDAETLAQELDEVMEFLPTRYGDLGALISRLPAQPTQELRLPAAPPLPAPPRFQLVLPSPPTPGFELGPEETTRLKLTVGKNEDTRKVADTQLLAQLSRNPAQPARLPAAPARPRRARVWLGAALGLLLVVEGVAALTHRKPEGRAEAAGAPAAEVVGAEVVAEKEPAPARRPTTGAPEEVAMPEETAAAPPKAPPRLDEEAARAEPKAAVPTKTARQQQKTATRGDKTVKRDKKSTREKKARAAVAKAGGKSKKVAAAEVKAGKSKRAKESPRSKEKGAKAAPARVVADPAAGGLQPIAQRGR